MKPRTLILPAVAVIASSIWITSQRNAISEIVTKTITLQERIDAFHSRRGHDDPASANRNRGPVVGKSVKDIDWRKIADTIIESQHGGGMGSWRESLVLQEQLREIPTDDLLTALDDIKDLGIDDASRGQLEQMLINLIAEKDPQRVLDHFVGNLHETNFAATFALSNAFTKWAESDTAAAMEWFDHRIAEGKFDPKSLNGRHLSRDGFESNLLRILSGKDPAAADARLKTYPEDQRSEFIKGLPTPSTEKEQIGVTKLIRGNLSANEQVSIIGRMAGQKAFDGSYDKVSSYLDRIQATPAERAEGVRQAADMKLQMTGHERKVTTEDIDAFRKWAATQSPEVLEDATGKALIAASRSSQNSYEDIANLALHYRDQSGSDDVLISFLRPDYFTAGQIPQARKLAEKISDPEKRESFLKNLVSPR